MRNQMIVGRYKFGVTSALLKGVAHERGFFWRLEVRANGRIEDDDVEAIAMSESWFDPMRPVERWQDLLLKEVSWKGAYDSSDGDARGLLYLYTHEVIDNASIKFSDVHGSRFRINWRGITDSSAGCFDDYGHFEESCFLRTGKNWVKRGQVTAFQKSVIEGLCGSIG